MSYFRNFLSPGQKIQIVYEHELNTIYLHNKLSLMTAEDLYKLNFVRL